MFATLKTVHVAAVIITASLFILRGYWMLIESGRLQHPFVRIAPHANDTILFVSALSMAWLLGEYPFAVDWLTAKFLALLAYIVLGHYALKRGRSKQTRTWFFIAALGTLAYIIGVALCRNPLTCLVA